MYKHQLSPHHLRNDDHVAQMRLDRVRLLARGGLVLLDAQLLQQGSRLTLDTTGELTTLTSVEQLHQLGVGLLKQLVQINTAVSELLLRFEAALDLLGRQFRLHEAGHLTAELVLN